VVGGGWWGWGGCGGVGGVGGFGGGVEKTKSFYVFVSVYSDLYTIIVCRHRLT